MKLSSYATLFIVLLTTAALSLAAPPPTDSSAPAPPAAGATVTPVATFDGFTRTTTYFQTCKNKAAEIEAMLQKLHAKTETGAANGNKGQPTTFLEKLKEQFPGATFDGEVGTIPIQKDFTANFDRVFKVSSIVESGRVTMAYLVTQGKIQIKDKENSVTILVDQRNPAKSTFVDVTIKEIKEEAEKIVTDPDRIRISSISPETAVLNDSFQLIGLTHKMRMDTFGAAALMNPTLQKEALQVAADGYRIRHPDEYKEVADLSKLHKKRADAKPNKPADARFYNGFIRTGSFLLLSAVIIWLIFKAMRYMKSMAVDQSKKMIHDQFDSLSPMVMKLLNSTGASLWGKNVIWAKNYYIYKRSSRWLLCDGKEEKEKKIFQARTRIQVSMRSSYFKLRVSRLNGVRVNISLTCKDLNERSLKLALEELCTEMTNFNVLGLVRDTTAAESAPPSATAPTSASAEEVVAEPAPHVPEPASEENVGESLTPSVPTAEQAEPVAEEPAESAPETVPASSVPTPVAAAKASQPKPARKETTPKAQGGGAGAPKKKKKPKKR